MLELTRRPFRTLVPYTLAVAITVVAVLAAPARAGSPPCAPAPLAGCRASIVPAQTRIWLHERSVNIRDTIVWKWRRGSTSTAADFGDPVHTHGYAMCIYAANGSLIFHATVPSGGSCGARPCWRIAGGGFRYRNGAATPAGLTKIILKAGLDGQAGVVVKGRGPNLDLPPLPITPPATIQLQEESGPCWGATYQTGGVRLNDGERFRAGATD